MLVLSGIPPAPSLRAMGARCCTGGSPPIPGLARAPWARAFRPLPPPARARFAHASGAGGSCTLPGPCIMGEYQGGVLGGSLLCPHCMLLPRAAGWGVPLPLPTSSAARVRRGRPFGGSPWRRPSSVGLPRSKSSLGTPLWFLESSSRGCLLLVLSGIPPAPSLRALGARCWVGVPLLPSPPHQPLALGVRNYLGRPLSSVSPSAFSLSSLSLLGISSPPSDCYGLPCPVAPCPSAAGTGPALSWSPTDAAVASLPYSWRWHVLLSVVTSASPVECAGGCPAPPTPSNFSISAS